MDESALDAICEAAWVEAMREGGFIARQVKDCHMDYELARQELWEVIREALSCFDESGTLEPHDVCDPDEILRWHGVTFDDDGWPLGHPLPEEDQ